MYLAQPENKLKFLKERPVIADVVVVVCSLLTST